MTKSLKKSDLNVALPVDGIACETVGDVIGMVEGVVAA